jgi:hypothetical protein
VRSPVGQPGPIRDETKNFVCREGGGAAPQRPPPCPGSRVLYIPHRLRCTRPTSPIDSTARSTRAIIGPISPISSGVMSVNESWCARVLSKTTPGTGVGNNPWTRQRSSVHMKPDSGRLQDAHLAGPCRDVAARE